MNSGKQSSQEFFFGNHLMVNGGTKEVKAEKYRTARNLPSAILYLKIAGKFSTEIPEYGR